MKAKEALLAAGKIETIGRGRISLDNHAWLKAQYDSGVRFTDWPKGKIVESSTTATNEVPRMRVVRPEGSENEKVISEFTILYPKNEYVAKAENGKWHSMANACNNCRVSLVQCHCGSPVIFGNTKVVITKL